MNSIFSKKTLSKKFLVNKSFKKSKLASVIEWVAELDGVSQYWELSEGISLLSGYTVEFQCVGSHSTGVLLSTSSFGLQVRLNNGVYQFFGCEVSINGVSAQDGVTTYEDNPLTKFVVNVTTGRPLGTLLSKASSFLSASAMIDFKVKDADGIIINKIPLTNKDQGATQLATVGNINAFMPNYTDAVWKNKAELV